MENNLKIFVEENGQFGGVLKVGKEIFYELGSTEEELVTFFKEGISFNHNL